MGFNLGFKGLNTEFVCYLIFLTKFYYVQRPLKYHLFRRWRTNDTLPGHLLLLCRGKVG